MGLRGPIQSPFSRRGERAIRLGVRDTLSPRSQPTGVLPIAPAWLCEPARDMFTELVADLVAASVPVRVVDGHAIAITVNCCFHAQQWGHRAQFVRNPKRRIECEITARRYRQVAHSGLESLGATPRSRLRLGLDSITKPPSPGSITSVLAAKQKRGMRAQETL